MIHVPSTACQHGNACRATRHQHDLVPNVALLRCVAFLTGGAPPERVTSPTYCRVKVEFNSINLARHGNSTTFETGLSFQFSCS